MTFFIDNNNFNASNVLYTLKKSVEAGVQASTLVKGLASHVVADNLNKLEGELKRLGGVVSLGHCCLGIQSIIAEAKAVRRQKELLESAESLIEEGELLRAFNLLTSIKQEETLPRYLDSEMLKLWVELARHLDSMGEKDIARNIVDDANNTWIRRWG